MRLFRLGLWIVVVAMGCKREPAPTAGALRVDLSYATFRPGCLTLTAADKADASRSETQRVELGPRPERSRDLTLAVYRKEGWSRNLVLTATAYERSCEEQDPRQVVTQTVEAEVPVEGITPVRMDLRAEDLDDDRYVKADQGGSDCDDDDPDVNPGVPEDCDGRDDNCSGSEADAPNAISYYADADKDGYGNPATRQLGCIPPAGSVTNGRDCNDDNAAVRPDQDESLCDGRDENCNNIADDTFNVDAACITDRGCAGAFACADGGASALCVSTQPQKTWYVDADGDQRAGTDVGLGCQPPVAGAVDRQDDCDDSSRFAFDGGTERCDRLDNDCNGQVDEVGCGSVTWQPIPNAGASSTTWRAVAAYAEGKAWVAGPGNALAHVEGGAATAHTDCAGDWVSAWARPSDGRVFLGSSNGVFATRAVQNDIACETATTGRGASINGLVGFESGATTTLFAATSDGRVYRWTYPGTQPPEEITRVAANLRDIHGTSPTNLVAVGAEAVASDDVPRAFHSNPDGGAWIPEPLPTTLPPDVFLRGVHMVHGQLAYAAGDKGVLLQRSNGTWTAPSRLVLADGGTPDLLGVTAYGRTSVYAIGNDKTVYLFDGSTWTPVQPVTWTPFAIDGVGPHDLWIGGSQGQVLHWGP